MPGSPHIASREQIANELRKAVRALSSRGLVSSSRWVAELLISLTTSPIDDLPENSDEADANNNAPEKPTLDSSHLWAATDNEKVDDRVLLAKTYFDAREYLRCAHILTGVSGSVGQFLRRYSLYLAGEKRKEEERREINDWREPQNEELNRLRLELEKQRDEAKGKGLDGFEWYLLGCVYKRLEMKKMAKEALVSSISAMPYLWGSWLELSSLMEKPLEAESIAEKHWIGAFFLGHYYVERVDNERARNVYENLEMTWPKSGYVKGQLALALYNSREFDEAEEIFERQMEEDPFWLDLVDVYSNILYVKEKKKDLSHLAHRCVKIDKYRAQTCCVVGNYHALRKQHQVAVLYFQRALKLNRHYLTAWILIGHEYIEVKNPAAAVEAYRRAVDINPWDFRAWYGLGQTYELLNMPRYTLYYFQKVTALQPSDPRMWCAVGEAYVELDRYNDAVRAYERAVSCDDEEGVALSQLAVLYEKLASDLTAGAQEVKRFKGLAAKNHEAYLLLLEEEGRGGDAEAAGAVKFLAELASEEGRLKDAGNLCEQLMEFGGTQGHFARQLLRDVEERQAKEAH